MLIAVLLVGCIGIAFVLLGWLIWKKEKISLLHEYHYSKVSDNDKSAFCKDSGIGVMRIGVGLLVTAVLLFLTDSALSFLAFAVGMLLGLGQLISAGRKYNR